MPFRHTVMMTKSSGPVTGTPDGADAGARSGRPARRGPRSAPPTGRATWTAPTAATPVHAVVQLPGSKSITARALLLGAMSAGPSTLLHPSQSRDSVVLARGLRTMGCHVSSVDDEQWLLRPRPLAGPAEVELERSGTAMRFLPPVAGFADGPVSFDGDPVLHEHSLRPLLTALRQLGVEVDGGDQLPVTVHGRTRIPGGEVLLDAFESSQLISGLLLAGVGFDRGVVLRHEGPPLRITPHIELTVAMLRSAGAGIDDTTPNVWEVEPGRLIGRAWTVEPDLASAAAFLAAALITAGQVTVPGWPTRTAQSGDRLRELLVRFGADCRLGTEGLTVTGAGTVRAVDTDVSALGELVPVIVALCALADAPSRLRGIGLLGAEESRRLAALADGLDALGGLVRTTDDGLVVTPRPLHAGHFDTRTDHRLAHAGALLGLAVPGVVLSDVSCTAKTMPDFPERWSAMTSG